MKYKIILLVIFIVCGGSLFARQYNDLLAGNWAFTAARYPDDSLLYDSSGHKEYITFSGNGTLTQHQYYFTNYIQPVRPDTVYLLYEGKWKLTGNILTTTIETEKTTGVQQQSYKKTQADTIVQLTAETLVLRTTENVTLYYTRTTLPVESYMNTRRENNGLYVTTPGTINSCCGDTLPVARLRLERKGRKRKITIDNFEPISLIIEDTTHKDSRWSQLEGNYVTLNNQRLWMNVYGEDVDIYHSGRFFMQGQFYYTAINVTDSLVCRPIPIEHITSVIYSSRFRRTVHGISSFTLGAGLVSALIVSPLVNVQYKEGVFNGSRYLRWAGWSLAAVAVSIPLNVFSRPKTYRMNKWQIEAR